MCRIILDPAVIRRIHVSLLSLYRSRHFIFIHLMVLLFKFGTLVMTSLKIRLLTREFCHSLYSSTAISCSRSNIPTKSRHVSQILRTVNLNLNVSKPSWKSFIIESAPAHFSIQASTSHSVPVSLPTCSQSFFHVAGLWR